MVEWWQALLFALLPICGSIVGWHLNARTTGEVQKRQQVFDAEMQQQRFDADRLSRSDDARRVELRRRLEPVYEALAQFESWLIYEIWVKALDNVGAADTAQSEAIEFFPQGVPDGVVENVLERLRTQEGPAVPRVQDVLLKLFAASARVGDRDLLGTLQVMLGMLSTSEQPDIGDGYLHVSAAYEKLEAYIARPVPQ